MQHEFDQRKADFNKDDVTVVTYWCAKWCFAWLMYTKHIASPFIQCLRPNLP